MGAKPKELRDYQEAILRALEDGLLHHRDELTRIGIAAVDPQYALAMYQQAQKGQAEKRFTGLTEDERFAEIGRQRYEGAKLQVTKFLSHMETRLLAEVVEFAPPATGRKRKKRVSYRITDRGRARLAGASDEQIDENWVQEARDVLVHVAQTKPRFTIEDVWEAPLAQPTFDAARPLDPIFAWAVRKRYIQDSDEWLRSPRVKFWKSLIYGAEELVQIRCLDCDQITDPTEIGSSAQVVGFVEVFNETGSVATNKILDAQPTGLHRCASCTEQKKQRWKRRRQRG